MGSGLYERAPTTGRVDRTASDVKQSNRVLKLKAQFCRHFVRRELAAESLKAFPRSRKCSSSWLRILAAITPDLPRYPRALRGASLATTGNRPMSLRIIL